MLVQAPREHPPNTCSTIILGKIAGAMSNDNLSLYSEFHGMSASANRGSSKEKFFYASLQTRRKL